MLSPGGVEVNATPTASPKDKPEGFVGFFSGVKNKAADLGDKAAAGMMLGLLKVSSGGDKLTYGRNMTGGVSSNWTVKHH